MESVYTDEQKGTVSGIAAIVTRRVSVFCVFAFASDLASHLHASVPVVIVERLSELDVDVDERVSALGIRTEVARVLLVEVVRRVVRVNLFVELALILLTHSSERIMLTQVTRATSLHFVGGEVFVMRWCERAAVDLVSARAPDALGHRRIAVQLHQCRWRQAGQGVQTVRVLSDDAMQDAPSMQLESGEVKTEGKGRECLSGSRAGAGLSPRINSSHHRSHLHERHV